MARPSSSASMIGVKSYEKGREKWQGETLDWVWFDEEPPIDIYMEGLTRTNVTGGRLADLHAAAGSCRKWCGASSWRSRPIACHSHDDRRCGPLHAENANDHRQLSGTRAGSPHQGRSSPGLGPHLPGVGGV